MATAKPRLRLALLCSHVDFDRDGLPFALNEPIHTLQIPAGTVGRLRPPPLALHTQLEDAVGTFPFSLDVRDERDVIVNPNSPRVSITFPGTEYRAVPLESNRCSHWPSRFRGRAAITFIWCATTGPCTNRWLRMIGRSRRRG